MELVTIFIDDKEIKVPKGTNLIEAARGAGIEIPHYCYHPHLSIAGNCRMCQVQVEGQPKLTIACNTGAIDGMKVRTQQSSPAVGEAQRATLEFLLINHPLDCTVCDQAGHCKLQDYYYDYNTKPSRFLEEKVQKVKAEELGPEIIYDGERCIVCTRCARFCEEVPGTSELGVFNRGDHAVIGAYPGHELNNPFSGTVVDLCPVGALTHKRWRFNTRIWYTEEVSSVCPGCSTGCNVRVATRDDKIVHVKARLNSDVNREWLCDEGRYGFSRFQPAVRAIDPLVKVNKSFVKKKWEEVDTELRKLTGSSDTDAAVFLSPFLTVEELEVALQVAEKVMGVKRGSEGVAIRSADRELNEIERKLISPDRAPNVRASELLAMTGGGENWRELAQKRYQAVLSRVRSGVVKRILTVGDLALGERELDGGLMNGLQNATVAVCLTPRAALENTGSVETGAFNNRAHLFHSVILPCRTVNEKSGTLINSSRRLQRLRALLQAPFGAIPEWQLLDRIGKAAGKKILSNAAIDDRGLYSQLAQSVPAFSKFSLADLGEAGTAVE